MSMFAPSPDVDPEYPEIIREEVHTARRHHTGKHSRCASCGGRILAGRRYRVVVGVDVCGDFFIHKEHVNCFPDLWVPAPSSAASRHESGARSAYAAYDSADYI